MVSLTFDTHKVVKDLQDAGFDETQAEAVVNALGNAIDRDVVRPDDLKEFATKADIVGVREEIAELRQDTAQLRAEMHTELKALELRLTIRLTGLMFATSGLLFAALKLFP